MSRNEAWSTRKYWETVGGMLIEEILAIAPNVNKTGKYLKQIYT